MASRGSARTPSGASGASGRQSRTDVSRLCDALFGATPIAAQCHLWAAESPRFAAFLSVYQGKIGKKLRGVRDEAGYFDVLAELEVARRLLVEPRFALVYEPLLAEKQRGPDFAVTFKTHTTLMVEVRRLRPSSADIGSRLANVFTDKLRQLPPSAANTLVLAGSTELATAGQAGKQLQQALAQAAAPAQHGDDEACRQRGFAGARDLLRRLGRLSAVVTLEPPLLWQHTPAQHPLPADVRKALARAFDAVSAGG